MSINRQMAMKYIDIVRQGNMDELYYRTIFNLMVNCNYNILPYIGFICPDNTVSDIHIDITYTDILITNLLKVNNSNMDYSNLTILQKFYMIFNKNDVDIVFNKLPHVL